METLLQGMPCVSIYLEDFLITGKTESKHLQHLQVLTRLQQRGMKLKQAKCAFMLPTIEYLGHNLC